MQIRRVISNPSNLQQIEQVRILAARPNVRLAVRFGVPCNGVARQPSLLALEIGPEARAQAEVELFVAFTAVATSKESSACRKPQYRKR